MPHVTSTDGTSIAYSTAGQGPPLILVGGGLDDGSENAPLMPLLAARFTVYHYARRGRGGSGDTLPYALACEIEDLGALISVAGRAHLFGASSGGALALHATASGLAVERVAVYEVPYISSSSEMAAAFQAYGKEPGILLSSGQRGGAVELFMCLAGAPPEDIAAARQSPVWPALESLAPTLAFDAACLTDVLMPARLTVPVLVATGGQAGFFEEAADALVAAWPQARRQVITQQGHVADPAILAPLLTSFFLAQVVEAR